MKNGAGAPVLLKIKVVPGASKNQIAGWLGDRLKIRVAAPPEKGKANKAVIATLADYLGLAESDVSMVSGSTSANKLVALTGINQIDLNSRLPGQA